MPSSSKERKSVTFATTFSSIIVLHRNDYSNLERKAVWYTKPEVELMRHHHQLWLDAIKMKKNTLRRQGAMMSPVSPTAPKTKTRLLRFSWESFSFVRQRQRGSGVNFERYNKYGEHQHERRRGLFNIFSRKSTDVTLTDEESSSSAITVTDEEENVLVLRSFY